MTDSSDIVVNRAMSIAMKELFEIENRTIGLATVLIAALKFKEEEVKAMQLRIDELCAEIEELNDRMEHYAG